MYIRSYLRILRGWLWMLLLSLLLGIGISLFVLSYRGLLPSYKATATVSLGTETEGASQDIDSLQLGLELAPTYAELAQRPPLTQAVVDALGLPITADELAEQKLEVVLVQHTAIIEITATDRDPVLAAAIANEVARYLGEIAPVRPYKLIQIVGEAEVPRRQSYEPYVISSVAGVLTLVLALGIVLMAEYFRDRLLTAEEAAQRLGLPILGTIGSRDRERLAQVWSLRGSSSRSVRLARKEPIWPVILDTFERLRSTPEEDNEAPPGGLLLVTSPEAGEGKLVAALSLARAWAMMGMNVILVDADPYHPSVHRWFGVSNELGLTDLLQQSLESGGLEQLDAILAPTDTAGLAVLPSGLLPADTSTFLLARPWRELLRHLALQADAVVIHGPPILFALEGVTLATNADGVLLVLDVGKTTLAGAKEASQLLQRVDATLLGALLNKRRLGNPRIGGPGP